MKTRPHHFECHLTIEEESFSAIDFLAEATDFSKQKIKQVMQKGAVWLTRDSHTQRVRRATKILKRGDQLHCYYDEIILEQKPEAAQLISDEGDYSIWCKPYGMRSQGSKWGDHTTLYRYAEQNLEPERPAFIVHRLDRAATGLILLAHKKKVAAAFSDLFKQRAVDKRYRVIVHGQFPDSPQTSNAEIDGKPACSHVALIQYSEGKNYSLLEVRIDTGRKHQIRRHLAGMGFPVIGDRLYSQGTNVVGAPGEDLQLTACYLGFVSPLTHERKEYRLADDLLPSL